MRYCTPELHNAHQPADTNEDGYDQDEDWSRVEKASAEWDRQLELYEARLKEIDDKLPQSVKTFMKTCFLHDAQLPKDNWTFNLLPVPGRVQLVVRQQDWGELKFLCVLRYKIAKPGHIQKLASEFTYGVEQKVHSGPGFYDPVTMPPEHRNSNYVPCWLYDEWDHLGTVDGEDIFLHSFYLSDGVEFNVLFTEFSFLYVPIGEGFVES